ncbi:YceI family protein [Mycobacterium sp. NPDC003323]
MDLQDWAGTWRLDPQRTTVTAHSPTFWGFVHVKSVFEVRDGSAVVDGDRVTGSVTVDAASVRTGIKRRDEHLRSADFFDTERFPTVEVAVDSAEVTSPSWVTLQVRVTIKGREQEFDLPAHVRGLADGAVRLSTTATLNRRTFGVDGNLLGMMGDAAGIEAAAVFVRQP